MSKLVGTSNISSLLQESMCYIGQALVFAEAEEVINHLSGAQVNAKQIERVCHQYGQWILDADEQAIEEQVYQEYAAEQVDKRHYVSVDGAMYLTREESWKENKLGRIYQQGDLVQMSNKRTALLNSTYVSHLGEHRDFITKMDYQLENLNELVFIADGARWIWKWADKTYPESVQIVDFRDFYGLSKGRCIVFFIFSVIPNAGKDPVNNLVAHSVQYQHFVLALLYFSVVVIGHFSLTRYDR